MKGIALASCFVTACALTVVDLAARRDFGSGRAPVHALVALAMITAVTSGGALAVMALSAAERRLCAASSARVPGAPAWVGAVVYAVAAAAAATETAFWTFSGARARRLPLAGFLPYAMIVTIAFGALVAALLCRRGIALAEQGQRRSPLALAAGLGLGAVALVATDLGVLVGLYDRLHTLLEASAIVLASAAVGIVLSFASRRRSVAAVVRVVAGACLVSMGAVAALSLSHSGISRSITRHLWDDPVYAGRALRRIRVAADFVRAPLAFQRPALTPEELLIERFDLPTTSLDPIWSLPPLESQRVRDELARRQVAPVRRLVVFYVDTLRADVAMDARRMPNVAELAAESLVFTRAYSSASATPRALPELLCGCYAPGAPPRLLDDAGLAGLRRVGVVPESASKFLMETVPSFKFDDQIVVPDVQAGDEKWGFTGRGSTPTAGLLVDRALDWMRGHREENALVWISHFDVHNWSTLDTAALERASGLSSARQGDDPLPWGYRAAAVSVDASLGRLRDGLRQLGLDADTSILLLADHGECVGYRGFEYHTVYVWEPLVRVPLILRVPGIAPLRSDEVVSLVDVAPTVAALLGTAEPVGGFHGESLLRVLLPSVPSRPRPVLLTGTRSGATHYVGLIDPPWKLVLSLESGEPTLHDLRVADPDAVDVIGSEPARASSLLGRLVRSPVFPRP